MNEQKVIASLEVIVKWPCESVTASGSKMPGLNPPLLVVLNLDDTTTTGS